MRRLLPLALSLLLAAPAAARAAEPQRMYQDVSAAAGCGVALGASGQPVRLSEPLEAKTGGGLRAGIFLTLYDPTGSGGWDTIDWDKAPACPHARFAADDVVWTIHAGAGAGPVRWIHAPGRETFVLMKGPSLADAVAWNGARVGLPPASAAPAYYLVALADELHFVIQVYDGPPSLRMLADDVAAMVEHHGSPLAVHDPHGDAITVFRETAGGVQAELFRPDELPKTGAAIIFLPDGQYFRAADDGETVLFGSRFACPSAYGTYKRDRLAVADPQEATLELACQWTAGDEGVLTLWVMRAPDASGDKAFFESRIRQAEADSGVVKRLSAPPTGRKSPLQAGRNWIDKNGYVQVDFFARQGEYIYEIRQTHTTAGVDPASKALLELIEQVGAPAAARAPWETWKPRT